MFRMKINEVTRGHLPEHKFINMGVFFYIYFITPPGAVKRQEIVEKRVLFEAYAKETV